MKTKRTLSVLLVLMLMLSLAVPAFAAVAPSIVQDVKYANSGETVSITMTWQGANDGAGVLDACSGHVRWDPAKLQYLSHTLTGTVDLIAPNATTGDHWMGLFMAGVHQVSVTYRFKVLMSTPGDSAALTFSPDEQNVFGTDYWMFGPGDGWLKSDPNPIDFGEVSINIRGPLSITINPASTSVVKGGSATFTGTPTPTADTTVTYAFSDGTNATAAGSTINATTGALSVAAGETSTSLTVRATATNTNTTNMTATADATVTITDVPVVSVSINPTAATVVKGNTQTFTATVSNDDTPPLGVTFAFADGTTTTAGGSTINATSGVLSVAAGETSTSLTVRATSVKDTTKHADAAVTIQDVPVLSVAVAPKTADVYRGATQAMTATVTNYAADNTVTWSMTGATSASTTINAATGAVTVGADETPGSILTVTATSNEDGTKTDTASLNVKAYGVTFNGMGSAQDAALAALRLTPVVGTAIKADAAFPAEPTKTGNAFLGWVNPNAGSAAAIAASYLTPTTNMSAADVLYAALWTPADNEATDPVTNVKIFASNATITVSQAAALLAMTGATQVNQAVAYCKVGAIDMNTGADVAITSVNLSALAAAVGVYNVTFTANPDVTVALTVVADPVVTPSTAGSTTVLPSTGEL